MVVGRAGPAIASYAASLSGLTSRALPSSGISPASADQRGEVGQRDMSERLQDLLVAPAVLASFLVHVDRHAALGLQSRLDVAEQ